MSKLTDLILSIIGGVGLEIGILTLLDSFLTARLPETDRERAKKMLDRKERKIELATAAAATGIFLTGIATKSTTATGVGVGMLLGDTLYSALIKPKTHEIIDYIYTHIITKKQREEQTHRSPTSLEEHSKTEEQQPPPHQQPVQPPQTYPT